jgi:hypothetical protein
MSPGLVLAVLAALAFGVFADVIEVGVALASAIVLGWVIREAYRTWLRHRLRAIGVVTNAAIESELRSEHGDGGVNWSVAYSFRAGDIVVEDTWAREVTPDVGDAPRFRPRDTRPVVYDPGRPSRHGRIGDW